MSSSRSTPSVHRRALLTWAAVYPTITVAMVVMRSWIAGLPLPVQTLVLTAVVVPVAAYGLLPLLMRLNARLSGGSQ
ncbi:hypothetical protein [Streptomyces maoxianensis]|uniref:Uncharacterized protein n=1 Tax=Streptomyces maoxianensis TaxID=1459942 RepID=A0ABV9G1R9_9ACTN